MPYICRECKMNTLKITGTGFYGDTITVQCQNQECYESYEVEPDGLGEGGMEMVKAEMIQKGLNV